MAASVIQNFSRFCAFPTQYRHILCSRITVPNIQQTCGLKKSLQEKIQALPEKPKRPMTPYFRFMTQVRSSVVQKHPNLKATEIIKLISQEWEKADPNLKKDLESQFRKDLDSYTVQKMKYDASLTPEQKADIKQIRIEKREAKEKIKHKQRVRELGRPKKPPTSFVLYMNSEKTERGNTPYRDEARPSPELFVGRADHRLMDWDITRKKASEIVDVVKKIVSKDVVSGGKTVRLVDKDLIHIQSSPPPTELVHADNTRVQNNMNSLTTSVPGNDGQHNLLVYNNVNIPRNIPSRNYDETSRTLSKITSLPVDSNEKFNNTAAIKELNTVASDDVNTITSTPTKHHDKTSKNLSKFASFSMDSSTSKSRKINFVDTTTINVTTVDMKTNVKSKINNDTVKSNNFEKDFQDETVGTTKTTDETAVVDKVNIKKEKELLSKDSVDYSSSNIIKKYSSHLVLITFILVIVATFLRVA